MSTYRNTCEKCGDETITEAWEPEECPFCAVHRLTRELAAARAMLPTAEERAEIVGALNHASSFPRLQDATEQAWKWLARLEAARVGGEGM